MHLSGQETEDWLRRLRCLYVKRDLLRRPPAIGEEAMYGCGEEDIDCYVLWRGQKTRMRDYQFTRQGCHDASRQRMCQPSEVS